MFEALFEFFSKLYYSSYGGEYGADLESIFDTNIGVSGIFQNLPLWKYLAFISSLISFVIIVVLCCLFVYKIIKLIGGLIR